MKTISGFILFLGLLSLIWLIIYKRSSFNPTKVSIEGSEFLIAQYERDQVKSFDIYTPSGLKGLSLSGSTDIMCDDPYIVVLMLIGMV